MQAWLYSPHNTPIRSGRTTLLAEVHTATAAHTAATIVDLRFRKIHLWMRSHELLQHVVLLPLVRSRLPKGLLPLVVHHLLHRHSCLPVQVRQLGVLRHDLLVSIDASPSTTQFHHLMLSNFSIEICTILLSTRVHMESSGL